MRKRRSIGLLVAPLAILVCLICTASAYGAWILNLTTHVADSVRPAARAVLNSYYLSDYIGAHLEDELEAQAARLNRISQLERMDFYRVIIVNCELDTHPAEIFAELVEPDASVLRDDLLNRLRAGQYTDPVEVKRVSGWIRYLDVIEQKVH